MIGFIAAAWPVVSPRGDDARAALEKEVLARGLGGQIEVCGSGCLGLAPTARWFAVPRLTSSIRKCRPRTHGAIVDGDQARLEGRVLPNDHPFYAGQRRIILQNSGRSDPERLTDYIAEGGFQALRRAVTRMTPQEVLAEVKLSGLRGRGGAAIRPG